MRVIDEYVDTAVDNLKLRSDTQLANHLGVNRALISAWRTKRAWPSEAVMMRLCEAANVPVEVGLLDLNIWRNGDHPKVQQVYEGFKKKLLAASLTAGMVFGTLSYPTDIQAKEGFSASPSINYAT